MVPFLVASLALAAILSTVMIYDGQLTWLEGMALIGLYAIIAVSFWWGEGRRGSTIHISNPLTVAVVARLVRHGEIDLDH